MNNPLRSTTPAALGSRARSAAALVTTAAYALVAAPPALAAPGDLDPTFGQAGRMFVDIKDDDDWPEAVVSQPDGRIVVGRSNTAVTDDFSVLRFNPDGSPDTSFGVEGRTSLDVPGVKGATLAVLLQPDGKIVAAGWARESSRGNLRLALVRYLEDGSPDLTFGNGGIANQRADIRYDEYFPLSLALQPDGRLVVAGTAAEGTRGTVLAVARLDPDGGLDRSFGQDGYVFGNGRQFVARLTLQPDGKLLVFANVLSAAPPAVPGAAYDWSPVITSLNADGSPDNAFGNNGQAILFSEAAFSSVAVYSDKKILLALANQRGFNWDGDPYYCGAVLARLNSDARLDFSFGLDGLMQVPLGGCTTLGSRMLIGPAGDIVGNGTRNTYEPGDPNLAARDHITWRLTASGELDGSFAMGGQSVLDVGEGRYLPYAYGAGGIVRQDDGKLVIVTASRGAEASDNRMVLARLQASGGSPGLIGIKAIGPRVRESDGRISVPIRRSGGSQGIVSVDYSTTTLSASSRDFIPVTGTLTWGDGDRGEKRIVIDIVADSAIEPSEEFMLSLANATGGAGLATSQIQITITTDATVTPITVPTARTNAGGGGGAMSWDVLLLTLLGILRLTSHRATRDRGRSTASSAHARRASCVVCTAIAAIGVLAAVSPALAASGDLDPTFGRGGRVILDIENDNDSPAGLALQPDGKIIVGRFNTAAADDFSVVRFNSDGSPDTSFDADGRTSLDIPGIKGTTQDLLLQPDGKIVAVGAVLASVARAVPRLALVRYLENGSPDPTFGDDGLAIQNVDLQSIGSVALQRDGRLLVAGTMWRAGRNSPEIAVARFEPDGSLDGSFGEDGFAFGNSNTPEYGGRLSLQADGRLLVFSDVQSTTPQNWYDWSPSITRFNADGSRDTSFGDNGRALVLSQAAFAAVMPLSDGKMLLALGDRPYPWAEAYCGAVLTRLHADARRDSGFGIDGMVRVPLGGCATFGGAILIDPAGNIVVDSRKSTNDVADQTIDSADYVVTRLTSSGELDGSFGVDGQAVLDVGDGRNLPYVRTTGNLLRLDDGKLVIVTSGIRALVSRGGDNYRMVLARLLASGSSPGLIGIKAVSPRPRQSDGRIPILFRRSGGSQGIVSVDYSTSGGAASAGFIPVSGTLVWGDGDRADKLIVFEPPGGFTLSLANITGDAHLATSEIDVGVPLPPTPTITTMPGTTIPPTNSNTGGGGGGAMTWEVLLLMAFGAVSLTRSLRQSRRRPAETKVHEMSAA